jgi:hypothetical protein
MKQKSRLNSVKGYFQIDIAFAILVFFLLFLTIYTLNKDSVSSKGQLIEMQKLAMDARDICAIIVSTPGYPEAWEEIDNLSNVDIFGLKNVSSYSIDANKLSLFSETNYFTIKNKFNENSYFNLKIKGVNSSVEYLNFGTNITGMNVKSSSYNCYSVYNSEPVKLIVEVWK